MTNLFDWFRGNSALTFARPWLLLLLDVSGSMLTKDFTIGGQEATRVDAIRAVTQKFIESRPNDRIGIIAFAGRPYVVSPMTLDHDWLLQNLDRVKIGLVEHCRRGSEGIKASLLRDRRRNKWSRAGAYLHQSRAFDRRIGKHPLRKSARTI